MKICVLTPYFHPHPGGSQRYIADLYGALVATHPEVHVDVICYNTDKQPTYELYQGLHVHRVPCLEILPGQFALPWYGAVIGVLRKLKAQHGKYDIVNSHTRFFDTAWWGAWAGKYLGAKSILTDHCAFHPTHKNWFVRSVTKAIDTWFVPLMVKPYDAVTVVSQATAEFVAKLGIKPDEVVYGGVDMKVFSSQGKQDSDLRMAKKLSFSKNAVVLSFVGRLIEAKGVGVLVEAIPALLAKFPQLQVMIAGGGPLSKEIEKLAREHSRVHFFGMLDKPEVARVLKASDIFAYPTTHHEGFPLALVEAGAAGCAVVTTAQGGITELIRDGENGMFIEATADDVIRSLAKLVEDSGLRKKLATSLQSDVMKNFTMAKIAAQYYQFLLKVQ